MVVGLAVLAGVLLIPRLSINLSALNVLQNVLPLANTTRRATDASGTARPGDRRCRPPPPPPGVAAALRRLDRRASRIPRPPRTPPKTSLVKLRRDGQPAANVDVWAIVHYSTTDERWPASGTRQDRRYWRGHDHLQHRLGHSQHAVHGRRLRPGRRSAVVLVDDLHPALARSRAAVQRDSGARAGHQRQLGPGFDCLGLALDLWNEVEAVPGARAQPTTRQI